MVIPRSLLTATNRLSMTEKGEVLDAIMRAAGEGDDSSTPLFSAMTDCGAGGFSSAIGELGKDTGATVHLERAAIKYAGLSVTEIWISEAQERMVLAVPAKNLDALRKICEEESVELAVLGDFAPPEGSTTENPDLRLLFQGSEVGRLSMHFLHDGIAGFCAHAIAYLDLADSARIPLRGSCTFVYLSSAGKNRAQNRHETGN